MKLRLLSILLAAMTVIPMALTSVGAENEILYGTPSVDGLVDRLYFQSLEVPLDTVGEDCSITQGTTYLLWNNSYLYFCAVSYEKPTDESAVCFCIRDDTLCQTIAVSAQGKVLACTEGADCTFHIDSSKIKTKSFDDYYVVEAAIAFDGICAEKKIGYSTLYFDNYYDYTYSMGGHFLFNEFTLSAVAAQNVVPETTVADTTINEPETNQMLTTASPATVPDSTESTAADTTTAAASDSQETEKGGCNSALGSLSLLLAVPAVAALMTVRKKKK